MGPFFVGMLTLVVLVVSGLARFLSWLDGGGVQKPTQSEMPPVLPATASQGRRRPPYSRAPCPLCGRERALRRDQTFHARPHRCPLPEVTVAAGNTIAVYDEPAERAPAPEAR